MLLPIHSRIMILGSKGRPQLQLWAPYFVCVYVSPLSRFFRLLLRFTVSYACAGSLRGPITKIFCVPGSFVRSIRPYTINMFKEIRLYVFSHGIKYEVDAFSSGLF